MFYKEHGVAHFHAVYGEYEASIEVESGKVHGELPPRALRLVLEWAALHKENCLTTGQAGTTTTDHRVLGVDHEELPRPGGSVH